MGLQKAKAVNRNVAATGVCILLAAAVLLVFSQTFDHGFVNYDDDFLVYENPRVTSGLSAEGVAWAFTSFHGSNWHPVTWISHMLDWELYGAKAGGHHRTSVLLHAATAVLLFLVLRAMTGALYCSALVSALFAIHPLRVESVAWVAERKDVLSGLFFVLTLAAYARYAKRLGPPRAIRVPTSGSYWLVVLLFALGLMSKPMLVTLPFVLLLIDLWPLGRLAAADDRPRVRSAARLIAEKLPLFALSAASCVVTLLAQAESRQSLEELPLLWRLGNAAVAYLVYLRQTLWPAGLSPLYLHPEDSLSLSSALLSLLLLSAISALVFALRKRSPYALVGWLWYLGMLVPVIGLVQVGIQAHADRYTYLPQIGLFIALAWGAADWTAGRRQRRPLCAAAAVLMLAALAGSTWVQTSHWRGSVALWTRALGSTPDNAIAYSNLGAALFERARVAESIEHFRRALQLSPDYTEAHNNLGLALAEQGRSAEAIEHYRRALRIDPAHANASYNLGNALAAQGRIAEASGLFRRALETDPDYAQAHNNLGAALASQGRIDEALVHYRQALGIDPGYADARINLGNALASRGEFAEAIEHYGRALEIAPGAPVAMSRLAWLMATCPEASLRDGSRAVDLAEQLKSMSGDGDVVVMDILAAAYAEAGRLADAVEAAARALHLAEQMGDARLASAIRTRLALYRAGTAHREPAPLPRRK